MLILNVLNMMVVANDVSGNYLMLDVSVITKMC